MLEDREIKPLDDKRAEQHYAWREEVAAAIPELAPSAARDIMAAGFTTLSNAASER